MDNKQNKPDDNLTTDEKTIVGVINEINVDYEIINLDLIKEKARIDSLSEQLIEEKTEKISKLCEELENNGVKNYINLKFAYVLEFEINKISNSSNFINDNLIALIVLRMEIRYSKTELRTDYNITLEELDDIDVMQGKDVIVVVSTIEGRKLIGRSDFVIKVTHNYDALQQKQFVEQFLQPAIPVSLSCVPETAKPNYNIPSELLLQNH